MAYPPNTNNGTRVSGRQSATGAVTIATDLKRVDYAHATLDDPSATANNAFVVGAKPSATPGSLDITCRTTTGALATVAANVSWTAFGLRN